MTFQEIEAQAQLISQCYGALLGRSLLSPKTVKESKSLAQALYHAPFVLMSHGNERDPIFNFANLKAQALFEMSWQDFTRLPSRFSSEQANREERTHLLQKVEQQGYIDDYSGIRISSSGQRFVIKQAVVWNLRDKKGDYLGQAAMFEHWQYIGNDT